MNRTPAKSPQVRAAADVATATKRLQEQVAADAATEAALNAYAEHVASDDFDLPDGAVAHVPDQGETRAFLERFVDADELDRVARGGRPSLSGTGTSPKRQVRLPADIDAALTALAERQGRKPSVLMREAIEAYVHSA